MFFIFVAWWLHNSGDDEYGGLAGEDINWSGHSYYDKYTGKGLTIAVMSDGALFDHEAYRDRAIENQFISIYSNEIMLTTNSSNKIATASLALAAGKRGTKFEGVAPGANVASYYFTNYSNKAEHLQTVICHRSTEWNISILQYLYLEYPKGYVRYVEPEVLPQKIAEDCLYNPSEGNWPHPIVIPTGYRTASDPVLSPPGGWPLIFTIGAVSNRGLPLYQSSEGSSVFMAAPVAGNAPIYTASPSSPNATNKNFTTANASAAIFAGGLAVLLEANPNLTLSDLFYVTAFSADKVYPNSLNWDVNAINLNYHRRLGFGRLNLGRAVDVALNWTSTGNFYEYKVEKTLNLIMPDKEYNVTFDFDEEEAKSILSVSLFFKSKKLSFGSLNPHIISPKGTRCEVKLITEADTTAKIRSVELLAYKFLGENPKGKWTVSFRIADDAYHGTIENIGLKFYYNKIAPNLTLINQRKCRSPFESNQSKVTFKDEKVTVVAGERASIDVEVDEDAKKAYYSIWLSSMNGDDRIFIDAKFNSDFTKIVIPYVPSVFKDQLEMILIVDSMDPRCIYSSNVSLNYRNLLKPGIISPKNGTVFSTKDTDLNIEYALQLERIFYDGYSTSTVATILSPESKAILTRKWIRNVGNKYISNIIPSTKKFYLQISPASTDRYENFDPMTIELYIVELDGKYKQDTMDVYKTAVISIITVLYVIGICFLVYRYIILLCLSKYSLNCYFE